MHMIFVLAIHAKFEQTCLILVATRSTQQQQHLTKFYLFLFGNELLYVKLQAQWIGILPFKPSLLDPFPVAMPKLRSKVARFMEV